MKPSFPSLFFGGRRSSHNPAWAWLAACAGLAAICLPATAQDYGGIRLKDGRYLEAIITGIDDRQVSWRNPAGGVTQPIPYDRIDAIDFPPLEEWTQAMDLFDNGKIEEAVEVFKPLSTDITKRTGYPAPGNFATLAKRRLLDCYRTLSRPTDIAYIQENIDWNKLPAHERKLAEIIELWAAVGNGKWEDGLAAAEKAEAAYRTTDPEMNEIGFLRGLIHKNLEEPEDAIVYFGEGYGLVTSNPRLAATSMIEGSLLLMQILPDFPERDGELKATLHLYAELIGNGKLWDGAPAPLVELFQRPEGTPEVRPPPGDGPKGGDKGKDKG